MVVNDFSGMPRSRNRRHARVLRPAERRGRCHDGAPRELRVVVGLWADRPGAFMPRLLAILVVAVAGMLIGLLVLIAAEVDLARSPAPTAAGAAAFAGSIGLLAAVVHLRRGARA